VATVLEPYRTTARYSPHIAVLKPREDCELESAEPSNALWWADPAELVGCRKREYASSQPAQAALRVANESQNGSSRCQSIPTSVLHEKTA